MISNSLKTHIDEISNLQFIDKKEVDSFLQKFKGLEDVGISSNSIFYILNLNTMNYEYINDACTTFTGYSPKDFYQQGVNMLPKTIIEKDFDLLSNILFPKMNSFSKKTSAKKSKIIFEIYYKIKNRETGKIKQIVEFSSYSKFAENGTPVLSAGMCYESSQKINGVKGIVRINKGKEQIVLFEESLNEETLLLTKTERKIAKLLIEAVPRKEIASLLNVSLHTINTHTKNIYKKLKINKVTELKKKLH